MIELAGADETLNRAYLLRLAAGIGPPVEPDLLDIPFDRTRLEAVSDELWSEQGDLRRLSADSICELEKFLVHDKLVHRTAAAFALAFARDVDEKVFDALAEAQQQLVLLSREKCHFNQALMGMLARAIRRVTD